MRLNVSSGAITTQQQTTTTTTVEAAGFTVIRVQWPVSDQSQNGMVVYQTPTGQASEGSAIVIYVGAVSGG